MAQLISKTLASLSTTTTTTGFTIVAARKMNFRQRSGRTLDVDLEREEDRIAMKKLEDAIHQIIVKKSEPDWLPFIPGASYWVPPNSKSRGFSNFFGKMATHSNSMKKDPHFSNCGCPSSTHFFKGASNTPSEGELISKHTSQSEDEE